MKSITIEEAVNGYIVEYYCKETKEYVRQIHTQLDAAMHSVRNKLEGKQ